MYIQSNRNYVKKQMIFAYTLGLMAIFFANAEQADWAVLVYMHAQGSLKEPAQSRHQYPYAE